MLNSTSSVNNSVLGCPAEFLNCATVPFYYKFENVTKWNVIAVSVFNFIASPFTLFLNFLAIYTVYRRKKLRKMSNLILCSLALADMLTGLFSQPLFGVLMITSAFCVKFCLVNTTSIVLGNFLSSISVVSLFLITLDRQISIFYPFYYEKVKDEKVTLLIVIVVIWVVNIAFLVASLATPKMLLTSVAGTTVALVIFFWSLYVNLRAVMVVKKIRKEIASHEASMDRSNFEGRRNSAVMSRVTRVVSTILGSMIVCYMPFVLFTFLEIPYDLPFNAWVWISTLVFFNSLTNPLVYFLQMKEMREEMAIIVNRFCCCRTVSVIRHRFSTVATHSIATTLVRRDDNQTVNN